MNIKSFKNAILVKSGITAIERKKHLAPRVLFYHGVSDRKNAFVEGLHISPDDFKKQLLYLQRFHEIISMDEYYQRWKNGTFTNKEVTLTFDDGYKNNLTVLAPILSELGIPFTVFISTRHIDTGNRFSTFVGRAILMHPELTKLSIPEIGIDCTLSSLKQRKKVFKAISFQLKHQDIKIVESITERLINHLSPQEYQDLCKYYQADALIDWEGVAMLQNRYGCTIGSHCLDHFICDTFQDDSEIKRQIAESKRVIEEKLGTACHYLAYPNGNTCPTASATAEQAGYRLAFTTSYKRITSETSAFAMPRYGVAFGMNTFIADMTLKPR